MRITHFHERREDIVPRLLLVHDLVREHTAIPADVAECSCRLALFVAEPETCVVHDVELAVWIGGEAMAAGFIV